VFGVLKIAFARDRIAGGLRVARELKVFLGDVVGGSPDLYVRTVGFVHACQRIMAAAIAPAHALVLSISHFEPSLPLCGIAASPDHPPPPLAGERTKHPAAGTPH
jgi:hypothetical protein